MDVYKVILKRRSIRRFQQKPISLDILEKCVNAARLAPSAANLQPLEFFIVDKKNLCEKVFETLGWAGYIKPTWAPKEDERPVAYIIIIVKNADKNPWYVRDASIAAANIVLVLENYNIGSCIICKFDKEKARKMLEIPNYYTIDSVIALGYKSEKSVVVDLTGSVEYWRDDKQVLHVPKRKLKDIIHFNKFK